MDQVPGEAVVIVDDEDHARGRYRFCSTTTIGPILMAWIEKDDATLSAAAIPPTFGPCRASFRVEQ
jgi:hypothetical protein